MEFLDNELNLRYWFKQYDVGYGYHNFSKNQQTRMYSIPIDNDEIDTMKNVSNQLKINSNININHPFINDIN